MKNENKNIHFSHYANSRTGSLRKSIRKDRTDNHLMLIDLRNKGITGKEAQERLERIGIATNKRINRKIKTSILLNV